MRMAWLSMSVQCMGRFCKRILPQMGSNGFYYRCAANGNAVRAWSEAHIRSRPTVGVTNGNAVRAWSEAPIRSRPADSATWGSIGFLCVVPLVRDIA